MGGYYSPNPNETITASNWKTYVRDQTVNQFTTASARTSAITSPVEGMLSYRSDEKVFEGYNGTSWLPAGWIPIVSTVVGSPVATVTWSSIPQTYRNLVIVAHARITNVSNTGDVRLQFNSDTGTRYANMQVSVAQGGVATTVTANAETSIALHRVAAASVGNSSSWGGGFAYILGYSQSSTSNKIVLSHSGFGDHGNAGEMYWRQGSWGSGGASYTTATVTRIDLTATGGSNFSAGSTFQLYGFGA